MPPFGENELVRYHPNPDTGYDDGIYSGKVTSCTDTEVTIQRLYTMDPPCVCPVSRVWCMEDAITGMPADCCEKLWIDGITLDHMPHGWEDEYNQWEYYIKDGCFWLKDNTWENEDDVIVGGLGVVEQGQGDGRAGMAMDESVHAHGRNVGNNYTNNNNFTQDTQLTDNTNTSFGGLLGRDLSKIFIEIPQSSLFDAAATFISMNGYGNESIRETPYAASQIKTETLKCLEKLRIEQMASELDLCLENISSVYENDPSQQNVDFDEEEVKELIKSSYYEYSITQALADATGITIWLRDTTTGVRYIITPNTKSVISSPMNIACDLIDHKEEEKGLFALEEETSRMDMSEGGKSEGGMNSSSDEEFDGDNMDEDSESGSNDSVALAPTHVTQEIECGNVGDIFSPSGLRDIFSPSGTLATSKFEQQFGIRARVRAKEGGINSVVVSGKEEDVDKAANYLITHHYGKSKNRIEEVDKGKEYTLLVHKLSPEAIMIATDEVEVPSVLTEGKFWKQKNRDDLLIDDLSKLSLYQVHIICKDGARGFRCSRTLNHPFTKLEGSVALLRAQKVLGKPQTKYGHTYNLSNMNHGEVRDILAKAGFFVGEYNTAASNE